MIAILLAAAVIPNFSADRALQALDRDDETVRVCVRGQGGTLSAADVKLTLLSRGPELVLVEIYNTCVCGAHNCPYWVYRVRGAEDERLLAAWAYGVRVVPTAGGVPDLVDTSHDSAAISFQTRYTYRGGTYVEAESWRLRGENERKPFSVPVHFAQGASSARLQGKVGADWGDSYTLNAAKGQTLEISAGEGRRLTVVRLKGGGIDRTLTPGLPVTLPATGTYTVDVEPTSDLDGDDSDVAYAFTLSIR
jgi:hypothetical protein